MVIENEFESEYCNVKYIENQNVVLIAWKKFCCFEDYRNPASFALELLKKYPDSRLVVNALNGFEDAAEDVEWGFTVLLPEISKTGCKKVAFIMNCVTDIEGEMDMWTKEFGKYFAVFKAETYEDAIRKMNTMIWVDVAYIFSDGKREEFYSKLAAEGIAVASRQEPGNYRYDFSVPIEQSAQNQLWLTEIWTDSDSLRQHAKTQHYGKLQEIKKEYDMQVKINKYSIQ